MDNELRTVGFDGGKSPVIGSGRGRGSEREAARGGSARLVTRHVQMGAEVSAVVIGCLGAGCVARLAASLRI